MVLLFTFVLTVTLHCYSQVQGGTTEESNFVTIITDYTPPGSAYLAINCHVQPVNFKMHSYINLAYNLLSILTS